MEQLLANQLDRLALARELGAQVFKQARPQTSDHRTRLGQASADERQIGGHTALEQVLHCAQAQVNAVKHIGRVVQQLHQGALAGRGQVKVGQLDHQRIGRVGCSRARQLIDQG